MDTESHSEIGALRNHLQLVTERLAKTESLLATLVNGRLDRFDQRITELAKDNKTAQKEQTDGLTGLRNWLMAGMGVLIANLVMSVLRLVGPT